MTTTIYIDVKIDWLSEINLLIEYLSTRKIIWRSQFISEGPSFSSLKDVKKSHTFQEGGAHLRISIWHLLMNLKNNYLLKKLLKWANKKYKNFNICNVVFFQKKK